MCGHIALYRAPDRVIADAVEVPLGDGPGGEPELIEGELGGCSVCYAFGTISSRPGSKARFLLLAGFR